MSVACYGGPDARKCDGAGILPFELHNGCVVMLCRLHRYQYKIEDMRCEARLLIGFDEDGEEIRERCQSPHSHIYITSEGTYKRLCDFHNAFMDFATSHDEQEKSA